MGLYIDTGIECDQPQLLQIASNDLLWKFVLNHAHQGSSTLSSSASRQREHAHAVYHLILYTGRDNALRLHGKLHCSRRGVLVMTGPGEEHYFEACKPGSIEYVEITFSMQHGKKHLQIPAHELLALYTGVDLEAIPFPVQLAEHQTRQLERIFGNLFDRLAQRKSAGRFLAYRTVIDLFIFLLQEVYAISSIGPAMSPLQRAREMLEAKFDQTLRIADLAAFASLSPAYFIRAFKREYGCTPIRYQQVLRINAAKNLLQYSGLRCKEIAAHVGFGNEYLFSRTFKKITGMPPTAFRRL